MGRIHRIFFQSFFYHCLFWVGSFFCFSVVHAYSWQRGEKIPEEGLKNIYQQTPEELARSRRNGMLHVLHWPVKVTGTLAPYETLKPYIPEVLRILRLNPYPASEGEGAYYVPFMNGVRPDHPMGFTIMERNGNLGVTFSCASCHTSHLFGRSVVGLSNRFPGANELIKKAIRWSRPLAPETFQAVLGASAEDTDMYAHTRQNLFWVEARQPVALGLDTSLAHVALSLSHRAQDEWASRDPATVDSPREEELRHFVADSKPAVWWNVKYKNRWLLDGSVLSGNPIVTNILWNEIGRGTDLKELEAWIQDNSDILRDLTVAIYETVPPRITDFLPAERIDISMAKKGEALFVQKCAKCHGTYEKAWSLPESEKWPLAEQIKTVKVRYFSETPVKNVGTDDQRRRGMKSLEQLNRLRISKSNGVQIEAQGGYVPPPLEGIWARFPYLHNNSVPNLCDLLKPQESRVLFYWSGEAKSIDRDFDFDCNGYPIGAETPKDWQTSEHFYDTRRPGQSNRGHDFSFNQLSRADRRHLIRFLQTL